MKIELGVKARDVVTKFEGVVVARSEHLTGCAQIALQPCHIKDGKVSDAVWFDENRIEVLDAKVVNLPSRSRDVRKDGGPQISPRAM